MDSLVITGNKDKLVALETVSELYDAYNVLPGVAEFVIKVFYSDGKPRAVTINFSGERESNFAGGKENA